MQDVERWQQTFDAVQRLSNKLLAPLGSREQWLGELQNQHRQLQEMIIERQRQLAMDMATLNSIQGDLNRITAWLADREWIQDAGVRLPLQTEDAQRELGSTKVSALSLVLNH